MLFGEARDDGSLAHCSRTRDYGETRLRTHECRDGVDRSENSAIKAAV
jgi:hypothetical protein